MILPNSSINYNVRSFASKAGIKGQDTKGYIYYIIIMLYSLLEFYKYYSSSSFNILMLTCIEM